MRSSKIYLPKRLGNLVSDMLSRYSQKAACFAPAKATFFAASVGQELPSREVQPMTEQMVLRVVALGAAMVLSAALAIASRQKGWLPLHALAKPLTVLLIVSAAVALPSTLPPDCRPYLMAGLVASVVGDVLLVGSQRLFVPGLVAFLLAHLAYSICFVRARPPDAVTLAALLLPLAASVIVLRRLWHHLGRVKIPVLLYVAALGTMATLLLGRAGSLPPALATLSGIGAAAFVLSDALLATRRFVGQAAPYWLELGSYFVAQAAIVASTLAW